jgi:hypothetical protein
VAKNPSPAVWISRPRNRASCSHQPVMLAKKGLPPAVSQPGSQRSSTGRAASQQL